MRFFHRPNIKRDLFLYTLLIVAVLVFLVTVVYAATGTRCQGNATDQSAAGHLWDCYRAINQQTTQVGDPNNSPVAAEWGQCWSVLNQTGKGDAFVPTNTSNEWRTLWDPNSRTKPLPTGLTLTQCAQCQPQGKSVTGSGTSHTIALNNASLNASSSRSDWKQAITTLIADMQDGASHTYNNGQSYWATTGTKSGTATVLVNFIINWTTNANGGTYTVTLNYTQGCLSPCPTGQVYENGICINVGNDYSKQDGCIETAGGGVDITSGGRTVSYHAGSGGALKCP